MNPERDGVDLFFWGRRVQGRTGVAQGPRKKQSIPALRTELRQAQNKKSISLYFRPTRLNKITRERRPMETLLDIDWESMFVPTLSLIEMFLRGSLIYLILFFMLRIQRRETGDIAMADILVIVLIADAVQNAMADEYKSIPEGLVLVASILFWDYILAWLAYRFPRIRRLIHPAPLLLIKDGRMIRRNMAKEMIAEDELLSQLREQGIDDMKQVKECYLEGEGHVSVIKK
jgi:hypothetical protein